MITPDFAQTMARYNRWQNELAYAAADTLSDSARDEDRGAFFGSITQTLNHLYWGDSMWLHRFAPENPRPPGATIEDTLAVYETWYDLCAARPLLDRKIEHWTASLTQDLLDSDMTWYSGTAQREFCQPHGMLVAHLFNHQTHHRGQVHAMLTAAGAKTGDSDLPLLPETR